MDTTVHAYMVLIPGLPLLAAALTAILGPRFLRRQSHLLVIFALIVSCGLSIALFRQVSLAQSSQKVADEQSGQTYVGYEHTYSLWTWADIQDAYDPLQAPEDALPTRGLDGPRDFRVEIVLRADGLTTIMLVMVTFISSLVAIFAAAYMEGDRGYWRFFTYIGLFVFSMTMLVSVSNFVLLFVFWEAVGVCSYLLIGFWYQKPEAAAAGQKAFLVNRVGDFGFALALFLIWTTYGTLDFHDTPPAAAPAATAQMGATEDSPGVPALTQVAQKTDSGVRGVLGLGRLRANDYQGGAVGLAICLLLMLGACGKSAQFPLHVWLPDAMEGPTPVSALIHAATMVTAGVYMVTRCTPLFVASPTAQLAVAVIGGITALLAALIALTQYDLKRVLAYSTVSQLGYMFLGLGAGSLAGISAGMFHLFTHAFFKALLFLGAGSVMHAMGNVIDMRRFGGLRKLMPVTYMTFFVGCLALAGVPPLSGFWSKDAILGAVHDRIHELSAEHDHGGHSASIVPGMPHTVAANGVLPKLAADAQFVNFVTTADKVEAVRSPSDAALPEELSREQRAMFAKVYQILYYGGLGVALLTAFYTFRAFFMTFFGEFRVPREAGHHAHESPDAMCWPLIILAVFAAGVGWYLEASHLFIDHLGQTPSLAGGAVTATTPAGAFHVSVAGMSILVATIGITIAAYLYLGDRSEIGFIVSIMNLEGLSRLLDSQNMAKAKNVPWIATGIRGAQRVGLGWLVSLLGFVISIVALILSAPLLIGYYVSPYRLSYRKFFWDEIYMVTIIWPLRGLAAIFAWCDRWLIDGLVNLCGRIPAWTGALMRSLQMGLVPVYGLAMVLGTLILIAAQLLWSGR